MLGKGKAERTLAKPPGWIGTMISIPRRVIIMQVTWSRAFTGAVYYVNGNQNTYVSTKLAKYWQLKFSIPRGVLSEALRNLIILLG